MDNQIQQIKEILCENNGGKCDGDCKNCRCDYQAKALYNSGWRRRTRFYNWFLLLIGAKSELTDEMVAAGALDFSGQGRGEKG